MTVPTCTKMLILDVNLIPSKWKMHTQWVYINNFRLYKFFANINKCINVRKNIVLALRNVLWEVKQIILLIGFWQNIIRSKCNNWSSWLRPYSTKFYLCLRHMFRYLQRHRLWCCYNKEIIKSATSNTLWLTKNTQNPHFFEIHSMSLPSTFLQT